MPWHTQAPLEQAQRFMFLRMGLTTILLILTLVHQIRQSTLIRPESLLTFFTLIAITYFVTYLYALFLPKVRRLVLFIGSQIGYDILFFTALIHITQTKESILTIFYLFIIIFASFIFHRRGALLTAAFASIFYSQLFIFDPLPEPIAHVSILLVNNLAFFLVAILSSYAIDRFRELFLSLKEKETSLEALYDFNQTILDNMSTGLLTLDNEGKITYLNSSAEKILKKSLTKVQNQSFSKVFPTLSPLLTLAETTQKPTLSYKIADEEISLGCASSELKDSTGSSKGRILMFEDLTKILEMEEQIRRADKLAAIGKMAAGIAHEIRNPLASVSGSVEVLKKALVTDDDNKKLMDIIVRETDRLNHLVSEFLEFVRPYKKKLEIFSIKKVLHETMEALSLQKNFPKNIQLNIEEDTEENLEFIGDKEKIRQVFWNLLLNAYQAMPAGGKIFIKTEKTDKEVTISITDTGEGMDPEMVSKIFDPFFTTKPKGTGLGLALVYKIIESHHGTVNVKSQKGKGTTFRVTFPSAEKIKQEVSYETQNSRR